MSLIHPTALIDQTTRLGVNVEVGPFSVIEENVIIGDNTKISSHVSIKSNTVIGDDCNIFQHAILGEIPQDLKFGGEKTFLEIGDRTTVRECCTLNRGTDDRGKTTIGSDVLLMAYVHVAHDCVIGDKSILANAVQLGGHVSLGYHVTVGGMTPIHQFCRVGDHAFVGGAYRVVQDVPPYILVSGEPLRYAGTNVIGLRRRGFSQETRTLIKKAYRYIYRSELTLSKAIESIKIELKQTSEIQSILNFIENSERGLV
ncbi:MAG: acyl-ACP--UDP-N-acetylglucosamine O-acyltransferase [Candidatus Marinimicrobia bacterium]|nr:acyl-ACP--UDP-N-acetylglucosamine O-acyltransferase [Candidatus Neomarinimicrobiota bacterium]MBL7023387.1 acyl-ACP--UDP-N-acetylglucosamine O-acyltransferase [Candidatus Neomarinimicrobiota bacterium]MBL7109732.1 acyl-ACP--UDP-N-acetylglucosamine O-acyltransferase [Candidatus Neomarinimicrobiota bacterium]